jgi:hypothetical protein
MVIASFRRTALLVLTAVVVSALSPTATRLMAQANAAAVTVEICTAEGIQRMTLPVSPAPLASSLADLLQSSSPEHSKGMTGTHGEGCAYCGMSWHTVSFEYPSLVFVAPQGAAFPPLFYQSPKPLFVWAQARSRAPPSL